MEHKKTLSMITKLGVRHECAFQTTFHWFFPTYLKKGRYLEQEADKIWRRDWNHKRRKGMTSLISNMLKLEFVLYLAVVSEPCN